VPRQGAGREDNDVAPEQRPERKGEVEGREREPARGIVRPGEAQHIGHESQGRDEDQRPEQAVGGAVGPGAEERQGQQYAVDGAEEEDEGTDAELHAPGI
jgi:hypothetical protein